MRNNKLVFVIGALILILVFGFVGYLAFFGGSSTPAPQAPVSAPAEIVWWYAGESQEAYREAISEFKKIPGNEQVNIQMVSVDMDEDYYQELVLGFARGYFAGSAAPDIFTIKDDDLPAFREFIAPLSNVTDPETGGLIPDSQLLAQYKEDFVDLVVKQTVYQDKIYGVTSYVDNIQLYYNEDILAQNFIAQPPQSWDDLETQFNKLNKRDSFSLDFDQSTISLGTGLRTPDGDLDIDPNIDNFYDIMPLLVFQAGGQLYDPPSEQVVFGRNKNDLDLNSRQITSGNFGKATFDEATNPTYNALQFYLSFANERSNRYSWNDTPETNLKAFSEGRLAYMLNYSGFQDEIAEVNPRLNYKVAELPQLDTNNKRTYGTFNVDVINRQLESKVEQEPNNIEAAVKLQKTVDFLHFLTTTESQESFVQAAGLPGARRDIIARQEQTDLNVRIFAAGALYADNYYKPNPERTRKIWGDMMYRIRYQNMGAEEALARAINEYSILVNNEPQISF